MARTRRPRGFGRPLKDPFLKRTGAALKDSARDRAELARRRLAMKLTGRKHECRCGKTFRSKTGRDAHTLRHKRETSTRARSAGRSKATPRVPVKTGYGRHTCHCGGRSCKGTYRNHLEFIDHSRLNDEREQRAERRKAERGRRTDAYNARKQRGGRPKGAPKPRTQKLRTPEDRARWHAQRMQMAAGRMDRAGTRTPHQPSPRKVQPRERVRPNPR